jgi:methionyl aminopeptidase
MLINQLAGDAGAILKEAFDIAIDLVRPGIAKCEVNEVMSRFLKKHYAVSGLKLQGFLGDISISTNYQVVNGIPDKSIIMDGDLVSLDMSILCKGVFVDKAVSFCVGEATQDKLNLCRCARFALLNGALALCSGVTTGFVGASIAAVVYQFGFTPAHQFSGHRIGNLAHMLPLIPNFNDSSKDILEEGWCIAVEPVVFKDTDYRIFHTDGGDTLSSSSLSAHFEDTYIIHKDRAEVVTR